MVGALSLMLYQQISGPMATAARMTKKTMADTQMLSVARIVIMDASNQAAGGDCDSDGAIEPKEWRDTAGSKPTGAGLIPLTTGAPVTDPWGTDYGYCVWDVGAQNDPVTDNGCGANAKRLEGTTNVTAGSALTQTVLAIVAAGPDRQFQTTCSNYVDATTDTITTGGDDIVLRYTYTEASTATSALWTLKVGDPDVATIDKDLEVTGTGLITATAANFTGKIIAGGGTVVGTDAVVTTCNAANKGLIRFNDTSKTLEVCDGDPVTPVWNAAGSGGGDLWQQNPGDTDEIHYSTDNVGIGVTDPKARLDVNGTMIIGTDATACDATTKGAVQWDDTDGTFQLCDGTIWRNLLTEPSAGAPPSGGNAGYFVLTSGSYNQAFSGWQGANQVCLDELSMYDWLGKADALSRGMVNSTYVKAFLCDNTTCNNAFSNTRYYFAVANNPAFGGGYFDTNASGLGPGNDTAWSASNYFGGASSYWTLRAGNTATLWSSGASTSCNLNSGDAGSGRIGTASGTDGTRWTSSSTPGCNIAYPIICMVHPSPVGTPADAPIVPGPNDGYFVYTKTKYTGNLGGLAGADAACLTDLTTYNWLNKADATARGMINSTHIKAFLCDASTCNNALASTRYFFAASDNPSVGGAFFTTDTAGRGPNDFRSWTSVAHFGGVGPYWANRYLTVNGGGSFNSINWANTPYAEHCNNWTDSTGGFSGRPGDPSATSSGRWATSVVFCTSSYSLACLVQPGAPGAGCGSNTGSYGAGGFTTTLVVPAGCPVTFKAWGGGGSSGMPHGTVGSAGTGGGGGYATIMIAAQPNAVTYYLAVGGRGSKSACGGAGGAAGSGIAGYEPSAGGSGSCPGGGGGAASSVWTGGYGVTPVIVAGGGAGGGGGNGAGNGTAGGAGGDGGSGTGATTAGTATPWASSGGSGSGYPKGGGAAVSSSIGGKGGANYAAAGGTTVAGSGSTAGNAADPDRPGGNAGNGGNSFLGAGNAGEVGLPGGIWYSY